MPINEAALKQLSEATFTPKTFVDALTQICHFKDLLGSGDSQLHLDYQVKGAPVKAGEMIPFITFGIRQVDVSEVSDMDVDVSGVEALVEVVGEVLE